MRPLLKIAVLVAQSALLLVASAPGSVAASGGTIDPYSGKACHLCHRSKLSGTHVHSALAGNRCTPCHKLSNGNHLTDKRFSEAKDRTARLCYECHEDQSRQRSVHPPIIDNDCLGCHSPHSSGHRNQLKAPAEKLCFVCHDKALVKEEKAGQLTGFRNGERNLHQLHSGREKIPCLSCHQAHASSQDHLLKIKGGSGKDQVMLTYQGTLAGGSCSSSCHAAAAYLR